jgi:hypothetical protein
MAAMPRKHRPPARLADVAHVKAVPPRRAWPAM